MGSTPETRNYEKAYSDAGFWDKILLFAGTAGRELIERALQLYYAARNPDTPVWAKTTIYGALGYYISPADIIPDLTPLLGYTDDLGVLIAALATVISHITPEIKRKAQEQVRRWFGE